MKHCRLLLLLLLPIFAQAQQPISYNDWLTATATHPERLPLFGNIPRTREEKVQDTLFIRQNLALDTTARKASDHLIAAGFSALFNNNYNRAMTSFNYAWLMDSTNENVFWAFGNFYASFNQYDSAANMYDRGLLLNAGNPRLCSDGAKMAMLQYNKSLNGLYLNKAISNYLVLYTLNPADKQVLLNLASCYLGIHDCANAKKYFSAYVAGNGAEKVKAFATQLKAACGGS